MPPPLALRQAEPTAAPHAAPRPNKPTQPPTAPHAAPTTVRPSACKAGSYREVHGYRKLGHTLLAGACQACVSRLSAYGDTVGPGRAVCYKSVTNAAGTGCVKATALATPLALRHGVTRSQRCLPAGGTSHMMLLAPSSTFSVALLKAIDLESLRLAGLGRGTTVAVKRNVHTLKLTFTDPHHVIASGAGAMLQLTGHTKDVPTGLNVCFTASVGVC